MHESGLRIVPRFSKREVRKAGYILVADESDEKAFAPAMDRMNYWRAIHIEPLGRLLNEARSAAKELPDLLIAGRIKKRGTIIDKLRREGNVKDLDTMYDIAGCRIVVNSLKELELVVAEALKSPYCDTNQTRDYIRSPKRDGYRGVHIIYRFDDLKCGHALRAELQVRTEKEHAWATAVEMYDTAAQTRLKFKSDNSMPFWFFKKASAVIEDIEMGRPVEGKRIRAIGDRLPEGKTFVEVVDLLKGANNAAYLIGAEPGITIADHCLIDFVATEQMLSVTKLKSDNVAEAYFRAENDLAAEGHDIVLMKGFSFDGLRRLYPNYFGNIDMFIDLIEKHMDCFY